MSELESAGADPQAAKELAQIAISLKQVKRLEPGMKLPPGVSPARRLFIPFVGMSTLGGLLIGVFLVAVAQTTNPGTMLYPIKRVSENVAANVQPSYHGVLMMRRAQEVKQLVMQHSNHNLIAVTLADYNVEARAYKVKNYAAFSYCRTNLEQAMVAATGPDKQAITTAIAHISQDSD